MSHARRQTEPGLDTKPDHEADDEDTSHDERQAMLELARTTLDLVEQASCGPWRSLGLTVLDADAYVVSRMASMRGEVRFSNDLHPNAELIAHARDALPRLARCVLELLGGHDDDDVP